ncbi:hypothetical protein [Promicromonospora sp. NFX87]|uniref:hypothetical protein n=1 Tax=Promicromonospora sp. NFX87 TaxID=3402691 RepID=UPI003AFA537F
MFDAAKGVTRLERARAALDGAELRVGVRSRAEVVTPLAPPEPAPLVDLLPDRTLPVGAVVSVQGPGPLQGSASLTAWLLGATQHGRPVAVVGWPELGVVALSEAGVDLGRLYAVPDAGGQPAGVLAALVAGFEIVVAGPRLPLTPSERRRLLARARHLDTTILSARPWEGAALTLEVERASWSGPARGDYWLRRQRLTVVRRSSADGAGQAFEVARQDADSPSVTAAVRARAAGQLTG